MRLIATDAECAHFELSLEREDEFVPDVLAAEVASLNETAEYVTLEWYFCVETIRQVCSLLEEKRIPFRVELNLLAGCYFVGKRGALGLFHLLIS